MPEMASRISTLTTPICWLDCRKSGTTRLATDCMAMKKGTRAMMASAITQSSANMKIRFMAVRAIDDRMTVPAILKKN